MNQEASAPSSRAASSKHNRRKPKSAQSSVASRISSATTLLEAPEADLQESCLVMKTQEQQVDLRKRDKNFLKYHHKVLSAQVQ